MGVRKYACDSRHIVGQLYCHAKLRARYVCCLLDDFLTRSGIPGILFRSIHKHRHAGAQCPIPNSFAHISGGQYPWLQSHILRITLCGNWSKCPANCQDITNRRGPRMLDAVAERAPAPLFGQSRLRYRFKAARFELESRRFVGSKAEGIGEPRQGGGRSGGGVGKSDLARTATVRGRSEPFDLMGAHRGKILHKSLQLYGLSQCQARQCGPQTPLGLGRAAAQACAKVSTVSVRMRLDSEPCAVTGK